jgi:FLVCR family feline leukemia virus subgroup C receptor-related protein
MATKSLINNLSQSQAKQAEEDTKSNESPTKKEYKVYGYRWVILSLHSLALFAHSLNYAFFAAIIPTIIKVYTHDMTIAELPMMLYSLIYIPGTLFLSNFVTAKFGLKVTMVLGCIFLIMYASIRLLINVSFNFVIVGCIFGACAIPLFGNCIPKVAETWFGVEERALATSICTILQMCGITVGGYIPTFIIKAGDDESKIRGQVFQAALLQMVIITAISIIIIAFFREAPPSPPSASASQKQQYKIWESIGKIFTNPNLLLIIGAYSGVAVFLHSFIGYISVYMHIIGKSNSMSAMLMGVIVIAGLCGIFLYGYILNKTHEFRKIMIISTFCSFVSVICFYIALKSRWVPSLVAASIFAGSSAAPIVAIALEYSAEVAYPVSTSLVAGIVLAMGNVFVLLFTLVGSKIMKNETQLDLLISIIILGVFTLICIVLAYCSKRIVINRNSEETATRY